MNEISSQSAANHETPHAKPLVTGRPPALLVAADSSSFDEALKRQRFLRAETFLTSGPRKGGGADSELGEDCCCVILLQETALLVIADGTSEGHELAVPRSDSFFCNRLLAQTITACARRGLTASIPWIPPVADLKGILDRAWLEAAEAWNTLLAQPPNEMALPVEWVSKIPESVKFLDFSTTILLAAMRLSGEAAVARIGDSPFAIRREGMCMEAFRRSEPGRLFMRLKLRPQFEGFAPLPSHATEFHEFRSVEMMLAGSDGVGHLPEIVASGAAPDSVSALIPWILKYRPGTFDDKSLCLLSIENKC